MRLQGRGGLDQGGVDAHQRVEDWDHHEQCIQVRQRQDHREIGIEQPLQRRVGHAHRHQSLVHQPVAPQKRDPGNHPDHDRGPERHGAEQEEDHLDLQRANMKGEEIGDGEARDERRGPDDQAEFQCREICAECRAKLGQIAQAATEDIVVILQGDGRFDRVLRVLPEADRDGRRQWEHEEYQEDQRHRRRLQIGHQHRSRTAGRAPPGRRGPVLPGLRDGVAHLGHAAMNSFHLRTMYWFSSMTAFQQATDPMRSA